MKCRFNDVALLLILLLSSGPHLLGDVTGNAVQVTLAVLRNPSTTPRILMTQQTRQVGQ